MRKVFIFGGLLTCFAAMLFTPQPFRTACGGAAIILLLFTDPRALISCGSWRFWLFPVLFILLAPFLAGRQDIILPGGISYSSEQFFQGLGFIFNAYIFALVIVYLSRNFSSREITAVADRAGLPSVGLRIALAISAMSILRAMLSETWSAYTATRHTTAERLRELPALAGAAVRNSALCAERISVLFQIRNIKL